MVRRAAPAEVSMKKRWVQYFVIGMAFAAAVGITGCGIRIVRDSDTAQSESAENDNGNSDDGENANEDENDDTADFFNGNSGIADSEDAMNDDADETTADSDTDTSDTDSNTGADSGYGTDSDSNAGSAGAAEDSNEDGEVESAEAEEEDPYVKSIDEIDDETWAKIKDRCDDLVTSEIEGAGREKVGVYDTNKHLWWDIDYAKTRSGFRYDQAYFLSMKDGLEEQNRNSHHNVMYIGFYFSPEDITVSFVGSNSFVDAYFTFEMDDLEKDENGNIIYDISMVKLDKNGYISKDTLYNQVIRPQIATYDITEKELDWTH